LPFIRNTDRGRYEAPLKSTEGQQSHRGSGRLGEIEAAHIAEAIQY
jgi:hypothetical protein